MESLTFHFRYPRGDSQADNYGVVETKSAIEKRMEDEWTV